MANAWIIRPLPMAATAPFGSSIGQAANLANDYMGMVWGGSGILIGSSYIQVIDVDVGVDVAIDTIMAFGVSGVPAGATFFIQAATAAHGPIVNDASWDSAPVPPHAGSVLLNGEGVFLWNAPDYGVPPACRYWRIGLRSPTQFTLKMRRMILSQRTVFGRNYGNGAAQGVRDLGSADFSARGVYLRRRSKKLRTVGLTFSSVYKDELEGSVLPILELVGNTEPLGLLLDPEPNAYRQRRFYFGPLVGDLGTILRRHDCYQLPINMVSLI